MTRYTRDDVLRILQLPARHLAAWEREGLIKPLADSSAAIDPETAACYSFEHLSLIRTLREMRANRMSARSIRASIHAMQRVSGMSNPLQEASAVPHGSRLAFRHGGALLDPETQQLAFDFHRGTGRHLTLVCKPASDRQDRSGFNAAELQELFARAVQLEENPATIPDAVRLYDQILKSRPDHAPSCINLGTILYNQREFTRAEAMYRRATEADPHYALAFFDLGNVLDEMQNLHGAIAAYSRAIEIVPSYADAHYNLALAYERRGERRRALRHWMTYVRLDPIGPWASHARGQARKILALERLSIVSRSEPTASLVTTASA